MGVIDSDRQGLLLVGPNKLMHVGVLLATDLFQRGGGRGSERLHDLIEVTQLVR